LKPFFGASEEKFKIDFEWRNTYLIKFWITKIMLDLEIQVLRILKSKPGISIV